MKELGIYKTADSLNFSVHFDAEKQLAMARGPLPDLKEAAKVSAASEKEAVDKLSEELGQGVLAEPSRTK